MFAIVIAMIISLLIAGAVAIYTAYPSQGRTPPVAAWVGDAMNKATDALPTLESEQSVVWSLRPASKQSGR